MRRIQQDPLPEGSDETRLEQRRRRQLTTGRAMRSLKAEHATRRTRMERIADIMSRVASSPLFLAAHALWFTTWILWNTGLFSVAPFDPFPFGLLTMIVSLEAIFLTIFVLMAQSRESAIAELREELTLQVTLRMEAEVTKTLQLVSGLYKRLGHTLAADEELAAMLQPLEAHEMEREIISQITEANHPSRKS
jgi:uncharacterized membrane protein